MSLIERVESNFRTHGLLRPRSRLVVAVSGGLDSMVLLHLLAQMAPAQGWRLVVAHFNHRLRGRASLADERLVRKTAQRLQLPCIVEAGDVRSIATRQKLSIEMAARQLRHEFLARTARRHRAKQIVLAHHADDQVELFFLRLLRGAGSDGLAGMDWKGPSPVNPRLVLVRPLLNVTKAELSGYARTDGIAYGTDATNRSLKMDRNRVRHRLLPLLERSFQPNLTRVIERTMTVLQDESAFLEALAADWLRSKRSVPFGQLSVALQRRCLQRQLHALGAPVSFDLVESLRLHPKRKIMVAADCSVWREEEGRVRQASIIDSKFSETAMALTLKGRGGECRFGQSCFHWSVLRPAGRPMHLPKPKAGVEWFDAALVGKRVVLRHWRPGDRFQPIGMARAVKLQDLLTNAKIPQARRRTLVVAATDAGDLWWVEGLRIGEEFKLRPATKRRLRWSWMNEGA